MAELLLISSIQARAMWANSVEIENPFGLNNVALKACSSLLCYVTNEDYSDCKYQCIFLAAP